MKKYTPISYSLIIGFYFYLSTCAFAQKTGINSKIDLPTVSNEVFQAISQLYQYDVDIPLQARIIDRQEIPNGNKEKIVFKGINASNVPAYLVIPHNGAEKHPVIVIVDGIYGSKDRWFVDDSWPNGGQMTKSFVKAGFAVMILDAVYHGERVSEYEFNNPPWPFAFPNEFRQMVIQTATEYRRAIDYLSSRNEIDTMRIGMMGLSMGALVTFELASIEPRIKTAVAGMVPPLKLPELQAVDVCTFANHVRCSSFLMFMGNKDDLYTMEEAHELFNRIPISQKEFVEFNAAHKPPVEYVEKVTDWFVNHLK